jgi:uncharacterized protein with ParB-like and HNH nuclease domain
MQTTPVRLIQYFDGDKQNFIPLFQRPFSWPRTKWETLFDDLMDVYQSGPGATHFMGAIVSLPATTVPVGVNKYVVIDGQQRLATISILLCVLRSFVGDRSKGRISDWLVNRHFAGTADYLKLLPTHGDREFYAALVNETEITSVSHKIKDCYQYLYRQVKTRKDDDGNSIDPEKFLGTVEQGLRVVMINLDENEDPYIIFESLNYKGEPLTKADLIRNFVLMKFEHSVTSGGEQWRVYNTFWRPMEVLLGENLTDFIRYWSESAGVYIRESDLYAHFKQLHKAHNAGQMEHSVKELSRMSEYYARFQDSAREPLEEIRRVLSHIGKLKVVTCAPLVLRFFDDYDQGRIGASDLSVCLELIESFILRRAIVGVPNNALDQRFIQLSASFTLGGGSTWLRAALADGKGRFRWPEDGEFQEAIRTQPQYSKRSTDHFLARLEESFGHKEPADLSNATVEHVLPQHLTSQWVSMLGENAHEVHSRLQHTFGNLTLSGYNGELGDLPFEEKKTILAESHIELNNWIAEQPVWNEQVILKRSELLGHQAIKIWPGP